jgi:hypothetical protein
LDGKLATSFGGEEFRRLPGNLLLKLHIVRVPERTQVVKAYSFNQWREIAGE